MIVCDEKNYGKLPVLQGAVAPTINFEAVVIGALEQSFLEMVTFLLLFVTKAHNVSSLRDTNYAIWAQTHPSKGNTRPDKNL